MEIHIYNSTSNFLIKGKNWYTFERQIICLVQKIYMHTYKKVDNVIAYFGSKGFQFTFFITTKLHCNIFIHVYCKDKMQFNTIISTLKNSERNTYTCITNNYIHGYYKYMYIILNNFHKQLEHLYKSKK